MILDEELSKCLKPIIKKGDFEAFKALVEAENIDVSSRLYGKRESTCWPLLQKTLNDTFSNRNYLGRLKIANYIVQHGGNLNDTAPYQCACLKSFLDQHYYLKDTKADYDVYLHTLIFALELVRQDSLDVNLLIKKNNGFNILDAACRVYDWHMDQNHDELAKVARTIIEELVEKGALLEDPVTHYDHVEPLMSSF